MKALFLFTFCFLCIFNISAGENALLKLWYNQPAKQWVEALPIGNGRLGAMVFGNPFKEKIQLN
ncbi:MAG: glycoside hydrolase N-terminal domain-containing protein, partial [Calditrichaceae bacterium]